MMFFFLLCFASLFSLSVSGLGNSLRRGRHRLYLASDEITSQVVKWVG